MFALYEPFAQVKWQALRTGNIKLNMIVLEIFGSLSVKTEKQEERFMILHSLMKTLT